jgi:hypothetical protein
VGKEDESGNFTDDVVKRAKKPTASTTKVNDPPISVET